MEATPSTPALTVSAARRLARGASGWVGGVWLVIVSLGVYLPGFFALPPVDRDESRFAQASRQMATSGDLVIPRVLGKPRLNKPPLIYWLQSASASLLTGGDLSRDSIWMYRIPSLLGAIAAVLLTWRLACALFDPRAAWLAAFLLAITPIVAWEAKQARADMVLVALCVGAYWALWRSIRKPTIVRALVLWVLVALGILCKGPVTPMLILLGIAGLCLLHRTWHPLRATRPLLGLVVVAAVVLPWVFLVASRLGWSEYLSIVREETLGRSLEPKEGHSGPPGFHLAITQFVFFPGSLWIVAGLARAIRCGVSLPTVGTRVQRFFRARALHLPDAFLLSLLIPGWIAFELVSTKLPHYTMPLLPLLAILVARAALTSTRRLPAWLSSAWIALGVRAWSLLGVAFAAAAGALGWLAVHEGQAWGWLVIGMASMIALAMLFAGQRFIGRRDYRSLLVRSAWCSAALIILIGFALPRVQTPWVINRLIETAGTLGPERPLAFITLHEDSSIFLTRGGVAWISADNLDHWLDTNPRGLVVLPETEPALQTLHHMSRVSGFNYPKGQSGAWILAERAP